MLKLLVRMEGTVMRFENEDLLVGGQVRVLLPTAQGHKDNDD